MYVFQAVMFDDNDVAPLLPLHMQSKNDPRLIKS